MFNSPKRSLVVVLGFLIYGLPVLAFPEEHFVKPQLFLLSEYNKSKVVSGWVMSEKYDGIRAYWNGQQLLSRQGNVIHAPKWFTRDFPSFELDGELWLARNQFAQTQAIVTDKTPSDAWQDITYQIFEVPNQKGNLFQRLEVLQHYLQQQPTAYVNVIKQEIIADHQQIKKRLQWITQHGGEGLVIRNPNLPYVTGRQSQMQKVKIKQDAECRVVGYTQGTGKYSKLVGAIKCQILDEPRQRLFPALNSNNTIIKIGSGLTDLQRQKPPEIGQIISFQYMGLTKNGLPRFPVFLRVRK